MNSQAQPPRDKKRRRRWPRITLGVVMLGLVVFIAWNSGHDLQGEPIIGMMYG